MWGSRGKVVKQLPQENKRVCCTTTHTAATTYDFLFVFAALITAVASVTSAVTIIVFHSVGSFLLVPCE